MDYHLGCNEIANSLCKSGIYRQNHQYDIFSKDIKLNRARDLEVE